MQDPTFGSYFREFRDNIKSYVEARIEYAKLIAYEKMARAISSATNILILAAFGFFTFFFISITLALYLGRWLNDEYLGFVIISLLDFLIFVLLLLNRESFERMMMQRIIAQIMKEKSKEENNSDEATGTTAS